MREDVRHRVEAILRCIVDPHRDVDVPAVADKIIEIVETSSSLSSNTRE